MTIGKLISCIIIGLSCLGTNLACVQEQGARQEGHEHGDREHRHGGDGNHEHGERGEHNADLHGSGEGEEYGTQLSLSDTCDVTKNGAHLVLKWDPASTSFTGIVKNVSDEDLDRVRVEVHYTRQFEIGPTKPETLKPGESREVSLEAETDRISSWSTHAEIGNEEHGEGHSEHGAGEGRGEHTGRREGRGERGERGGDRRMESGHREHGERGDRDSEKGHGEGEHDADLHGEGEGEEGGTQLGLSDVYNVTKNGAHLVLKWDADSKSFRGVVKNVSDKDLERVRVEVHYARRFELGPTKPGVLKPGESREVTLKADTDRIASWNTHAEIGDNEHGGHGEHGEGQERGEGEQGENEHASDG